MKSNNKSTIKKKSDIKKRDIKSCSIPPSPSVLEAFVLVPVPSQVSLVLAFLVPFALWQLFPVLFSLLYLSFHFAVVALSK